MSAFVARWFRFVVAFAFALAVLVPAVAEADQFVPPNFEGNGTVGQNPDNALIVYKTVRNSLMPGQPVWYQVNYNGPAPLAVTVNTNPSNLPTGTVQMHVDWETPGGMKDADWPGYYRLGEGTPSGFGQGVLFWQTSGNTSATYLVELVNTSSQPVGYAIAITGSQVPPPSLNPEPAMPFTS